MFDYSSLGSSVQVHTAAIGYFNGGGAAGIQASVDLEFFDGISWNNGIPTLGPSLFRYSTATGASLGVTSSGINETPSLTSNNIVAQSGQLVVAWWMDLNPQGGNCTFGFQTNFATDNTCAPPFCTCTAGSQKNLIFIQGQGWRDAATATVSGFSLCPNFYNGNWIIRACVEPVGCPAPVNLGPGTSGSGGITPILQTSNGPPTIGNQNFGLTVAAGVGGAPGAMLFGVVEANIPLFGGFLYLVPTLSVPYALGGPAGVPGAGFVTLPIPLQNNPALVGAALPVQGVNADAGGVGLLTFTNGLRFTICP